MAHADDSGGPPSHHNAPAPSGITIYTLLALDVLLMSFTVVLWLLGNPTLTAAAGTGAVGLTIEIARRLLTAGAPTQTPPVINAVTSSFTDSRPSIESVPVVDKVVPATTVEDQSPA